MKKNIRLRFVVGLGVFAAALSSAGIFLGWPSVRSMLLLPFQPDYMIWQDRSLAEGDFDAYETEFAFDASYCSRDFSSGVEEEQGWARSLPPLTVRRLGARLRSRDVRVRLATLETLRRMGPWARPAVGRVLEALDDGDGRVRAAAAVVPGKIGPSAAPAVPRLTGMLKGGRDRHTVTAAAFALAGIGSRAREAVPALLRLLGTGEAFEAGVALAAIDPPQAIAGIPALVDVLGYVNEGRGEKAEEALGRIGPAAIRPLIEAFRKESGIVQNPDMRRRAANSLITVMDPVLVEEAAGEALGPNGMESIRHAAREPHCTIMF